MRNIHIWRFVKRQIILLLVPDDSISVWKPRRVQHRQNKTYAVNCCCFPMRGQVTSSIWRFGAKTTLKRCENCNVQCRDFWHGFFQKYSDIRNIALCCWKCTTTCTMVNVLFSYTIQFSTSVYFSRLCVFIWAKTTNLRSYSSCYIPIIHCNCMAVLANTHTQKCWLLPVLTYNIVSLKNQALA